MCEPCRENRRAAKRVRHAERRAAGLCVKCATPTPGGKAYCDPCAKARYRLRKRDPEASREAARRRYAERRARGDCTTCGKPANGAAECQACCDAARERHGWLNYFAVPGSSRFIRSFHRRLQRLWMRALRRRSQRAHFNWKRLERMTEILWPRASIRHPWPDQRFAVNHPR